MLGPEGAASLTSLPTLDELLARHDAELFAFKLLTEPEQAREQVRNRAKYGRSAWSFLTDCTYTIDQVDSLHPIKPFPSNLEYLELLTAIWLKKKLIAVPKSRRMICSWLFISLYFWDTLFHSGRDNAFVSKKEDDAGELVARAEHIFNKIPAWRIPPALLPKLKNGRMSNQPPCMTFEEINSKLQGFPMGADQLRQRTLSGIMGDEAAFWPEAQQFYSASKPTIDGGGRMTLISSRSPGFFKKIVFDKLDATDLTFKEKPPVPVKKPLPGVEIWTNPLNKFTIIDLHYTANPHKRGDAWREAVRQSMPIRDFQMEYEKSWQTYEGKAVFADYSKDLHTVDGPIEPEPGIPLLIGWDFGLTPAAVICQLVGKQLRVLEEIIETDGSIDKLCPVVWSHLAINYRNWLIQDDGIICFVDPAGNQRKDTDEKTCVGVMRKGPTWSFKKILFGPPHWEPRRRAVDHYLTKTHRGKSCLQISETGCPLLVEGFSGGYQFPRGTIEIEPTKIRPVKNKFSHPHDAFQYVCDGALFRQKQYDNLPGDNKVPGYGFQKT